MSKLIIAIPTYNRKDYLRDCLNSILNQTFSDFEVYVFDNCSNYDIESFLKEFNDPRIKLLKNIKNIGGMANFEKIFAYNFDSQYLVVFHDDDTMHPEFLEKTTTLLDSNEDVVFVGTNINFIKDPKKMGHFKSFKKAGVLYRCPTPHSLIKLILSDFNIGFDTIVYRSNKIIKDLGTFTYKYYKWSDRPYLIELSKKGKVLILKEKLVNYRIHQNQDSKANSQEKINELLALFSFYKKNFLIDDKNNKDKKIFYTFSTNHLILSGLSFANNIEEYITFIKLAREKKLFYIWYLNLRGVWYLLKVFVSIIFKTKK